MISEEYRALNAEMHKTKPAYGTSGHKWAKHVENLIVKTDSRSILDYGCGKQTLRDALPHRDIVGYDPCIEGLEAPPIAHDLVVCGDVLEHVEPEHVLAVLDHLQYLAIKAVFLVVATVPAVKTLPDGRNAHILIKDPEWWMPKIMERWNLQTYHRIHHGGRETEFMVTAVAK